MEVEAACWIRLVCRDYSVSPGGISGFYDKADVWSGGIRFYKDLVMKYIVVGRDYRYVHNVMLLQDRCNVELIVSTMPTYHH